jgi:thioredoxin-dependent peroxiredoxin
MKALLAIAATVGLVPLAHAALAPGARAPDFTLQASMGGKEFTFSLADALKKGPVVVYFYPAAFTPGCTIEAHKFAEAIDQYKALGATVIGVSHDPIDKLDKFSVSECRSKFPVAADADGNVMKSYDSVLKGHEEYADRTSYVITPDGKVYYAYTAMSPDQHVDNTLDAIKRWKASAGH